MKTKPELSGIIASGLRTNRDRDSLWDPRKRCLPSAQLLCIALPCYMHYGSIRLLSWLLPQQLCVKPTHHPLPASQLECIHPTPLGPPAPSSIGPLPSRFSTRWPQGDALLGVRNSQPKKREEKVEITDYDHNVHPLRPVNLLATWVG